jgi:hypothetical protein
MSVKDVVHRWKSELANASDNPAGMVELTQLDEIAGGQNPTYVASCTCTCCINCSVQASACCGTAGCS